MMSSVFRWTMLVLLLAQAWSNPVLLRDPDSRPLTVVSDLGQRLASHSRFQDSSGAKAGDPRLPLPTPQELEAIKKVAQILIMLGEQVIPSIIGDTSPQQPHFSNSDTIPVEDEPNDPVDH